MNNLNLNFHGQNLVGSLFIVLTVNIFFWFFLPDHRAKARSVPALVLVLVRSPARSLVRNLVRNLARSLARSLVRNPAQNRDRDLAPNRGPAHPHRPLLPQWLKRARPTTTSARAALLKVLPGPVPGADREVQKAAPARRVLPQTWFRRLGLRPALRPATGKTRRKMSEWTRIKNTLAEFCFIDSNSLQGSFNCEEMLRV